MNEFRKFYLLILVVIVMMLFNAGQIQAGENNSDDIAFIAGLVAKINRAWTADNGVDIIKEVISEKACIAMINYSGNAEKATILNKKEFLQSLDTLLKKNRPKKHVHEIIKITINGPIAYEIGVIHNIASDGIAKDDTVLHIYAKEQTGWMLISSTPADNL